MAANTVNILIKADDQASKAISDVDEKAGGLGKTLGDVGKIAGGFLAAEVIGEGFTKLKGFVGDSIAGFKEQMIVSAQTEAVIKSTGAAAGLSATEIESMAGALKNSSVFTDDAIQSGENLLLTFTNIGKDTFPRATQSMVDMSQALGQDLGSSAIQLGKALNDPIKGVTALSRVGVSFTAEQKEQIKVMTEAGDVAGAQALILAELEKEFGGSAKAASDAAGASEKYADKMDDLQDTLGAKLLPLQEKWKEAQVAVISFLVDKGIPTFEKVAGFLSEKLGPAFEAVGQFIADDVIPDLQRMATTFKDDILPAVQEFAEKALGALKTTLEQDIIPKIETFIGILRDDVVPLFVDHLIPAVAGLAEAAWPKFEAIFGWLADHKDVLVAVGVAWAAFTITTQTFAAITGIKAAFTAMSLGIKAVNTSLLAPPGIAILIAAIATAIFLIWQNWDSIWPQLEAGWEKMKEVAVAVKDAVVSAFTNLKDKIVETVTALKDGAVEKFTELVEWTGGIGQAILDKLVDFGNLLLDTGRNVITGLFNGAKELWDREVAFFTNLGSTLIDALLAFGAFELWLFDKGRDILSGLLNGTKDKLWDVTTFFWNLPGEIVSQIPNPLQVLWSVGKQIMSGLLNGIVDGWNAVAGYVSGVAGKIASLKGPIEKDRKLLIPQGNAIMEGLDEGLQRGFAGRVAPTLSRITDYGIPAAATSGGARSPGGGSSAVYNITVNALDARGAADAVLQVLVQLEQRGGITPGVTRALA